MALSNVIDSRVGHLLMDAELAKRYFFSRGPASIQDFAWWANLSLSEARKGLEMNKQHLQHVFVNGNDYPFLFNIMLIIGHK
jgi:hypothetical protein